VALLTWSFLVLSSWSFPSPCSCSPARGCTASGLWHTNNKETNSVLIHRFRSSYCCSTYFDSSEKSGKLPSCKFILKKWNGRSLCENTASIVVTFYRNREELKRNEIISWRSRY
jgi:hypothetical protein